MTAAEVRLAGVSKRYGAVTAVKPLDLVVEPGMLVTLLGPSGCGKTSLLRLIAGLERVDGGRISIGGRDVTDLPASARNVSMVFQSYALFPHMTVAANVAYGLRASGMPAPQARERAAGALDTVGLGALGARLPAELSGGQQQRVAVARALVLEPEVLLFDEPLSNLDARLRRTMREEIRQLQQRLALTVVYVTHDQSEALAVSDRIVVMRDGEIAQSGPPRALYEAPDSVFVATFMGEANHVRGRLEARDGAHALLRLGTVVIRTPHRGLDGEVDVVVRPEAVLIVDDTDDTLAGTIASATYLGAHAEYGIDTALGRLLTVTPNPRRMHGVGEAVRLRFVPAGVLPVRS